MSFSKQLTQLGLLGTFTLVGLSACTTWHGYQTVQNPCGPSPQTVVTATPPVTAAPPVTASPPITEAAPSTPPITPAVTPPPPEETSSATTPSVPGSQGEAPASGLPSGTDKPAGVVPPPPAPPAAASAGPGTSATTSAQAAESNRDQLQTQKPLDTTTSAPEVAGQPVAVNAAPPPGANVMVTIPAASKAPPANQPAGPLAKLRARFHNWIQPAPKSTAKALKVAKPSGPATAPKGTPQVVASVHIPLPLSDPNRVVQEDSRAAHTIAPAEEPSPVSTAGARDAQPGSASAAAVGFQVGQAAVQRAGTKPSAAHEIEAWPFGSQAAASANKVPNTRATEDFDPIPVEEYKAATIGANEANSLPAFNRTPSSQQSADTSSNTPAAQPMTAAPPASELQVVPPAIPPSQERPMLAQQQPQTVPTAAAGTVGPVAPAIQILPATPAEQAVPTAPRPAQWIGGRYGQPAWMVPYLAAPEGSARQ